MKSRRKVAMLTIAILQLSPLLVLTAEVDLVAAVEPALIEPPKADNKLSIPDEIPDVDKSSRLLPDVIHHHVPPPSNPPPKAVSIPAFYNNYKPMLSYPPPSALQMVAPPHPRYYNPYAATVPSPIMQLTPADDRIFSNKYQVAVVPPLIDRFPFNLWGPHGYFNLCTRTTPDDPVWSWGCAQAPYNVMGDALQQQQQQQSPQAQQFQQPPYFQQPPPYQAANPYPYLGSIPAASSTYNTYTLPSSPDPNVNFLQQLANQYAQNPSTGYTPNGYYNYGGGTYAPVPNTGNFMSSAVYSSAPGAPGRIYNLGPRMRNLSKNKKLKKGKAKPKVKQPVVKIEEEEEEAEEYVAEADEE